MKNLIPVFAVAVLLSALACKKVDKSLIDKMQGDLASLEEASVVAEKASTAVTNLVTQINTAPDAMKSSGNQEINTLIERGNMMPNKLQATVAEYNDLMGKLRTLVAEYNAGKINTEDAKKEYETLSQGLKGTTGLLNRIGAVAEESQTSLAKMTAEWNAKAEGGAAPK